MSRFVMNNPGVEAGVDTNCCRRRIPEVLNAQVATGSETKMCPLVFDSACLDERTWKGIVRHDERANGNGRNGHRPMSVALQLKCSSMGWRIRANERSSEPAAVEESWPLYLEFPCVETGDLTWASITVTE